MRNWARLLCTAGISVLICTIVPAFIWVHSNWLMSETHFAPETPTFLAAVILLGAGVVLVVASILLKRAAKKPLFEGEREEKKWALSSAGVYLGFFISLVVAELFFETDPKMPPFWFFAVFALLGFILHLGRDSSKYERSKNVRR